MKQEDTKQRILDKALELFSTYGYDSVSVWQIAEAVGYENQSKFTQAFKDETGMLPRDYRKGRLR